MHHLPLKSIMILILTSVKFDPLEAYGSFQTEGMKKHRGRYMCVCLWEQQAGHTSVLYSKAMYSARFFKFHQGLVGKKKKVLATEDIIK